MVDSKMQELNLSSESQAPRAPVTPHSRQRVGSLCAKCQPVCKRQNIYMPPFLSCGDLGPFCLDLVLSRLSKDSRLRLQRLYLEGASELPSGNFPDAFLDNAEPLSINDDRGRPHQDEFYLLLRRELLFARFLLYTGFR